MRGSLTYSRRNFLKGWWLLLAGAGGLFWLLFWALGPEGDPVLPPLARGGDQKQEAVPRKQEAGGDRAPNRTSGAPPTQEKKRAPDRLPKVQEKLRHLAGKGREEALRRELGALVLDRQWPRLERQRWLARLDKLNRSLVFSPRPCQGFRFIRVGRGDTYTHICRRLLQQSGLHLLPGLLVAINGISPRRLRAGQKLKVPAQPLSVEIIKAEFTLYVLLGKVPILHYRVGIGKEGLTPTGVFTSGGKARKPTWTDPRTGHMYRYGEPGQLIGSRWIRLYQRGVATSFGIHGTVDDASIGKAQSQGCIRLLNRDVEQLFDLLADGTQVLVK